MDVKIRFEKMAHIHLYTGKKPLGWGNYYHNSDTNLWTCQKSSEGFHVVGNMPYVMTEQEMLILALKS